MCPRWLLSVGTINCGLTGSILGAIVGLPTVLCAAIIALLIVMLISVVRYASIKLTEKGEMPMNKGISKMKTYWSAMLETTWAMLVSIAVGVVPAL